MLILCLLLLGATVTSAQTDGAQLRVGHYVFDAPAVNLYIDGELVAGTDGTPVLYGSMTLPASYLDLAAGVHTFAVTAEAEPLASALIGEQEFTLEAGHRYMLAVLGNVSLNDLHFTLIDETAAIAEADINLSAVSIIINNLTGIQSIDGFFDGDLYFDDLVYGDYFVLQDATEGSGTLIIADSNPEAVVLDVPEAVGSPAHFFAVFVFSGAFSGAQWDGYTALYTGQFEGELTILDGGPIAVGDALPVEFTEMGQRVQFTLTLAEPAVLDIVESGAAGLDAVARIYDPAGNLLYENGELTEDNNAEGIFDAGWNGIELDAGTFIIEAATFIDIGTGEFTLTVSEAE
ncbi:MAG: DUF4397 domain-containing protein [Chloroflexi bacterium]|uniref:DUF4397 domain-containing protein n=1 Tax=Candidatus Flexifilum breve TaxID=3140694 RepID=UPI0031346D54|nr:DUF4397 domain-containing protein [Chloroflexota bacterium]